MKKEIEILKNMCRGTTQPPDPIDRDRSLNLAIKVMNAWETLRKRNKIEGMKFFEKMMDSLIPPEPEDGVDRLTRWIKTHSETTQGAWINYKELDDEVSTIKAERPK